MKEHPTFKVLLVDDDTFLLNMYSMKFTKSNFEVSTAQSGTEAISKMKEGLTPDVILLDLVMPVMTGLELLEEIRKEKLVPNATVIMLTNQSDAADIEKARGLGVHGYIVKATTIPSEVVENVLQIHTNRKVS